MKKLKSLTVNIPNEIRFNLKMKALKNKTNVSNIVKKYVFDYIDGKVKIHPLSQKEFLNSTSNGILTIMIDEDVRYKLKEKAAQDRANIKTIILNFLEDYLKDDKQEKLSALEESLQSKQLKLFSC
jgi:hypothetical protein